MTRVQTGLLVLALGIAGCRNLHPDTDLDAGARDGAADARADTNRSDVVRTDGAVDGATDGGTDGSARADDGVTDTGPARDTGVAADSSPDAIVTTDTGISPDSGTSADTGVAMDSGTAADTGTATDTGSTDAGVTDTGASVDVAPPTDTGATDAGTLPAGMCFDEVSGLPRAIVSPTTGQLVINEWMPDPASPISDANGEWFELRATAAVDLNGLQAGVATLGAAPIVPAGGRCVHLANGGFALFAHTNVAADNGGLANVVGLFTFSLVNGPSSVQIGLGGATLATATWTTTATSGRSFMIDSVGTQCVAPTAVTAYTPSNFGTPGSANSPPNCP